MTNKEKPKIHQDLSAIGLGYTMMAAMFLCTLLGYWADAKTGGGYRWTLAGLLMGLLIGFYEAWKTTLSINQKPPVDEQKNKQKK